MIDENVKAPHDCDWTVTIHVITNKYTIHVITNKYTIHVITNKYTIHVITNKYLEGMLSWRNEEVFETESLLSQSLSFFKT